MNLGLVEVGISVAELTIEICVFDSNITGIL